MTELIITRGYPASGKSMWAREVIAETGPGIVRVNRDDLRASLLGIEGVGTFEQEQIVSVAQKSQVRALLQSGVNVIVDDTNLRAKYARAWADLAAELGAGFNVFDMGTPVDECVKRDAQRGAEGGRMVGEDVIRELGKRFPIKSWKPVTPTPDTSVKPDPYVPDETLPAAYIVDIDGTLAHMTGRDPYDYTRVHEDTVDREVWDVIDALRRDGNEIIVMSGRDEECRDVTWRWLSANEVWFDDLHMRPAGDTRKDSLVKAELFDKHVRYRYNVRGVFDDRDQVVQMWRAMGLKCFQVQPGAF